MKIYSIVDDPSLIIVAHEVMPPKEVEKHLGLSIWWPLGQKWGEEIAQTGQLKGLLMLSPDSARKLYHSLKEILGVELLEEKRNAPDINVSEVDVAPSLEALAGVEEAAGEDFDPYERDSIDAGTFGVGSTAAGDPAQDHSGEDSAGVGIPVHDQPEDSKQVSDSCQ